MPYSRPRSRGAEPHEQATDPLVRQHPARASRAPVRLRRGARHPRRPGGHPGHRGGDHRSDRPRAGRGLRDARQADARPTGGKGPGVTIEQLELVGIVTAIAALWSELLYLLSWPRKLLVVSRRVDPDAGGAILGYLKATGRSRPRDGGFYGADRMHVRPMGRAMLVFYERLTRGTQLAWSRRVPIWFAPIEIAGAPGAGPSDVHYMFYFLRGTVSWEELCKRAAAWDDEQRQSRGDTRYQLHHHGGSPAGMAEASNSAPKAVSASAPADQRLLHWRTDEIGYARPSGLDAMSLRPEVATLARDVSRFIATRDWFEERGIPWRRGWLLYGTPGTGKTTFVRSIALEHDLPVHSFDLGSMSNHRLRIAWDQMLRDTPCVALIEDIDGVYGVERADGSWDGRALRA